MGGRGSPDRDWSVPDSTPAPAGCVQGGRAQRPAGFWKEKGEDDQDFETVMALSE